MFSYFTWVGIQLNNLGGLPLGCAGGSIDAYWATQLIKSTRAEPEKCLTGEIADCANSSSHEESVTVELSR